MELFLTYPFFWCSLVGAAISAIVLWRLPKYRRPAIVVGLFIGICFLISEYWFRRDYWNINMVLQVGELGGIDDILFGLTAATCAVIGYDRIFHRASRKSMPKRYWIYALVLLNSFLALILLTDILHINSVVASSISYLCVAGVMWKIRPDLIRKSVFTGVGALLILVTAEALAAQLAPHFLEEHFLLYGKFPILLNFIVFTEVLWGFSMGSLVGILYDFAQGLAYRQNT